MNQYTYPLTEESLRQVCGTNTTFQKVTSGYGLFPQKNLYRFDPRRTVLIQLLITPEIIK